MSWNSEKKILFSYDNGPAHSSRVAGQKLIELRFELLVGSPYLSDLVLLDYHLFPKLKTFLMNQELKETLGKCVELRGNYVEE